MTRNTTLMTVGLLAAAACGKPKSTTVAVTDTSTPAAAAPAPLGDTAVSTPAPSDTVYVERPAPPPPPRSRHRMPPPREPARPEPLAMTPLPEPPVEQRALAAEPDRTLPRGTTIEATALDSIHSRYTQPGDLVHARIDHDLVADGGVVIPAGSVITLAVDDIARAPERGEKGTLALSARVVEIHGRSYPIAARATDYQYEMKARGVGAGEVAKTGAGAAIGAVVGHLIGGKTGTVVGAVGGGAAGAAVAAKTADRDIIVHAGAAITLRLRRDFSRS